MYVDKTQPDFGWLRQIGKEIDSMVGEVILAGHSLGASFLLKYLAENNIRKSIIGVFLLSTPFWSGDESWVEGLKLKNDFAAKLPENVPIFLYHCRDDDEVPFSHLSLYTKKIPFAKAREFDSGGHQFNNGLLPLADDIKSL